jgi:glycosyltransferase involved in cell wall biosynthesis
MNRTFIVIPCYNEETRLDTDAFARCLRDQPETSLVFVNDGSTDGTLAVLRSFADKHPKRTHVIDQNPNAGKAEAVRRGMLAAMSLGADLAGYWDADLATPLEAIPQFVAVFDAHPETELVLGARVALLGHEIDRKPIRHYLGRVFATGASLVLNLPVYDTQCGAKLMRCNDRTRKLFEEPFGSRWIFDVEMLARHLRGRTAPHQIRELPLEQWTDVAGSKVKPVDFFRALGELIQVHRRYRINTSYKTLVSAATAAPVHYAGAGAIGTVAHYLTLTLLVELLGASPVVGTVVGAAIGALINYFLNYHFTFTSYASHKRTLPRFLVVAGLGMAINAGGMWLGTKLLGINYLITQVGCTALVLAVGFVLNKLWTFGTFDALPVKHAHETDRRSE